MFHATGSSCPERARRSFIEIGKPQLRLFRPDAAEVLHPWPQLSNASDEAVIAVRAENVASAHASGLSVDAPWWVLANETQQQLEGAMLPPERRLRLLSLARKLGVRPFDANVIIAMAQDRARRGEGVLGMAALFESTSSRERMDAGDANRLTLIQIALALAVGLIGATLLIRWISG